MLLPSMDGLTRLCIAIANVGKISSSSIQKPWARFVPNQCRSTRLAQFMLFLSQSNKKGLNKSIVCQCKVRESAVDIYSLIKQDHEEVIGLFRRLKAAEGCSDTSEQLFAQLEERVELHA